MFQSAAERSQGDRLEYESLRFWFFQKNFLTSPPVFRILFFVVILSLQASVLF